MCGEPAQPLLAVAQRRFDPFALGDVDAGGMQEHDRARAVANGMDRELDDVLVAVGYPIRQLFAKNDSRRRLIDREADPGLHLLRAAPPGSFPKRPV